jgi:WD40 repeat protein
LKGHLGKVRKVRFLSDGKTLLSSSDDKTIRIWDTRSGKQLHLIETPTSVFSMEVLRPAERIVVSAGYDDSIRFWDIKTGRLVTTAKDLPAQQRWAMAGSPDGRLVAVGGGKAMLRLYSLSEQ